MQFGVADAFGDQVSHHGVIFAVYGIFCTGAWKEAMGKLGAVHRPWPNECVIQGDINRRPKEMRRARRP